VSFLSKKKNNLNGKSSSPTSPPTPTSTTKMRRRRLRTLSRSGDDRITFRGEKPIYTAGIYTNKTTNLIFQVIILQ